MKLLPLLLLNSVIDSKETRKTGIWLIFIGILSIFIYFLFVIGIIKQENTTIPPISVIIFGITMIIVGGILFK